MAQWVADVRDQAWSIYCEHKSGYDVAGRAHLRTAAYVLAMYRAVGARIDAAGAVELLKDALTDAYRPLFRRPVPIVLRVLRRPARVIAALGRSRLLQRAAFGRAFVISAVRARGAVELHIDRCLYHQFFARCGAPELTTVICHSDFAWIDALPARRRTLGFERPTTIGWGGERCVFQFIDRPGDEEQRKTR